MLKYVIVVILMLLIAGCSCATVEESIDTKGNRATYIGEKSYEIEIYDNQGRLITIVPVNKGTSAAIRGNK